MKTGYFLAVLLGWALMAVAGAAIWLHWFPGRGRVSTAMAGAVPLMLLAAIPAFIILALTRRWITAAVTVVALAVGAWIQAPLFRAVDAPDGARITLVQSNIKLGAGDVGDVIAAVRSSGAQLLTVEEMTPQALEGLRDGGVRRLLPYEFAVPGTGGVGTGIFSRFPLRNTQSMTSYALNNLRAELDLPGAPGTTVYAVHPIPPFPYTSSRWVGEMRRLRETVHATTAPTVIVSGDFNATWDHAQFRSLLRNGFRDATEQTGSGWEFTYPADRAYGPFIGIDHVISRGFTATSLRGVDIRGSDHRALVVSLAVG